MSSSEIVDFGRSSGQKSNFSHTCSLLSQYMKEKKGSFADLTLGAISRNFEPSGTPTQTMNLLPMIEKSGQKSGPKPVGFLPNFSKVEATKKIDSSVAKAETGKSQMTIFYGGQVLVFNDFPAEKAKEIMALASRGNNTQNPNMFSYKNATLVSPKPAESSATNMVNSPAVSKVVPTTIGDQKPAPPPITSEMPIARKRSLARFFEKRKDRISSKAPYQIGNNSMAAASSKPQDTNMAWLGLNAQIPVKIEYQS